MKKLLLALFVFTGLTAFGQITIVQNDMPYANDDLYRTRANVNPFLNYGATGPNYVWNFTNLTANVQDSANYQSVSSTNFVYALTYADIFFNPNRANHALTGVDIPFNNLLPIADPYTFYYRSSSVYKKVGYGVELAGIPVPIIYSNHDVIYNLPLNFGDNDSSFSSYNISIPTLAYYGYEQSRLNEVDGWGTINTPAGSFDALRVKTTLFGRDTINLDSLGLGFTIDRPVIREYKWLASNYRVPVMQVNTTELFGIELITDIFFYDELRTINVVSPLATIICPGSNLDVNFAETGVFNAGGLFSPANIFRAQLSDATGSFATPVNIGSVTSTQSGIISCVIPANTPPGTGYRIRVISTNPAFIGNDNGFDITVGAPPVALATANGSTTFCAGDSVSLSANTDPDFTYQWQLAGVDISGAVGSDYYASASGDYNVVITNTCGTSTSQIISVIVNDSPEHTLSQNSFLLCNGAQALITSLDLSGQSPLTYQWYLDGNAIVGEINSDITTSAAGNYTLEITNTGTGCVFLTSAASVIVDSVLTPVITAATATSFCDGGFVDLQVVVEPGVSYQWQLDNIDITGATGISYNALTGGVYSVIATSLNGCTSVSASNITVVVNSLPAAAIITASGNTSFCNGDSLLLSFIPASGNTYQWQIDGTDLIGATDSLIYAASTGAYTVIAVSIDGCTSVSTPTQVSVNALPVLPIINTTGNTTFCAGDSLLLETPLVAGLSYQWILNSGSIAGANGNQYTASVSGLYDVTVADVNGCSASSSPSISVTVNPLPSVPVITQSYDTLFSSPAASYQWYLNGVAIPGANSQSYIVTVNGAYTVETGDSNSCSIESLVFPFNSVSVYEVNGITIDVYPNPSAGEFIITGNFPSREKASYEVFDPAGKIIEAASISGNKTIVNLVNHANGIYVLRIQGTTLTQTIKIIKQ